MSTSFKVVRHNSNVADYWVINYSNTHYTDNDLDELPTEGRAYICAEAGYCEIDEDYYPQYTITVGNVMFVGLWDDGLAVEDHVDCYFVKEGINVVELMFEVFREMKKQGINTLEGPFEKSVLKL